MKQKSLKTKNYAQNKNIPSHKIDYAKARPHPNHGKNLYANKIKHTEKLYKLTYIRITKKTFHQQKAC